MGESVHNELLCSLLSLIITQGISNKTAKDEVQASIQITKNKKNLPNYYIIHKQKGDSSPIAPHPPPPSLPSGGANLPYHSW